MHGYETAAEDIDGSAEDAGDGQPSATNTFESAVLANIANELEDNNVDQMARDIFSFYICIRWVPDPVFWQMARMELASDLLEAVVDEEENIDQAIAELYQNYKFVPMLCSRNLEVFKERSPEDNSYFRQFANVVEDLSTFLSDHADDDVVTRLRGSDEVFCNGGNMNDPICAESIEWRSWLTGRVPWFGVDSTEDRWATIAHIFRTFEEGDESMDAEAWSQNLALWRRRFPYHSFVHKQDGMSPGHSPTSTQRFIVCFGKRVASQLHRRPSGMHIMTDQNNNGCHGFWTIAEVGDMLTRMVELWKPPTCQLSEMTYVMKREILMMFAQMNERLFDSLPSLVMDEQLEREGLLDAAIEGPQPFDPQSITVSGERFVDGMRVKAVNDLYDPPLCLGLLGAVTGLVPCEMSISVGSYGNVQIVNATLHVVWDDDVREPKSPNEIRDIADLQVVPREWSSEGFIGRTTNSIVSGVSSVAGWAGSWMSGGVNNRYAGLAELMSGSVSKWVVCPLRADTNYTHLDANLGVEDAAFQDFQREAYSHWTGYEGAVPGEECVSPDFFSTPADMYSHAEICEISELHADHIEHYTNAGGALEQFVCPLRPSLPAAQQLTVFYDKGMCLVRMTDVQRRQYQWPYNGDFPTRKQHDRKENHPRMEYELVKLLRVPSEGSVEFARLCSFQEMVDMPRFCPMRPYLQNSWPTIQEMVEAIGTYVAGALGLPAAAMVMSIAEYSDDLMSGNNASHIAAVAREAATALGESIWDGVLGAGRLTTSVADRITSVVADALPGAAERELRIERASFGDEPAGDMLHSLSFQDFIGASETTTNSRDRYKRYLMTVPCSRFDPALKFAITKQWSNIVLKMIQSGVSSGVSDILSAPVVSMGLRGEGRLFYRENSEADNSTWWTYGAALKLLSSAESGSSLPECEWQWGSMSCTPADFCQRSGISTWCAPRTLLSPSGWWATSDGTLVDAVGAGVGLEDREVADLKGVEATLYCGRKDAFQTGEGDTGGPSGAESGPSLYDCLVQGVESNARLRALEPWKTFFPEEVVVVAELRALPGRGCNPSEDAQESTLEVLCDGADEHSSSDRLDVHLREAAMRSQDGAYQGIHVGEGFPKGVPREVHLRPEDILEVYAPEIYTRR